MGWKVLSNPICIEICICGFVFIRMASYLAFSQFRLTSNWKSKWCICQTVAFLLFPWPSTTCSKEKVCEHYILYDAVELFWCRHRRCCYNPHPNLHPKGSINFCHPRACTGALALRIASPTYLLRPSTQISATCSFPCKANVKPESQIGQSLRGTRHKEAYECPSGFILVREKTLAALSSLKGKASKEKEQGVHPPLP